ncbi:DNA-binding LacI/PurR family transcriptional regulator [Diaminobutyricimonas aerilata]|uniref:DNA-binding LacI/PurR family transcriptional regulator n=1 Tax=Diaminobutyricimonas aerilata TaxID=1162967 RepID=A0A2M9CGM8_9MICO|nr:LacI family DNA-binding transcriptional regulator [Diaminobutyricimonas aerilata]PJJ71076.1 DNA-binding LacI/PurR family transcriptional regulator [Diaminobutyricimonas aerilata]
MATIFDVARLAGVSHQTVSRVVNGLPNVRPATRQRVEDAIRQLRYRPSETARALVTRRSRTLGVITTGSPDYGPSSTLLGLNQAAREARYNVIISSMLEADRVSMRTSVDQLLAQSVEAIVLIAAHIEALEAIQSIDLGVPLVAVDSSSRAGFHSVAIDQFEGARLATEHLIALGHRAIVHVAGPTTSMDAAERIRGWRSALGSAGLVVREPLQGDWSPRSGFEAGAAIAAEGWATAVFSANDQMALGLMRALALRGLRVPDDLAIVGFDDIPEAAYLTPPLTTVRQDFRALGADVMARVLALLGDDTPDGAAHTLPVLVVRESSVPSKSTDADGSPAVVDVPAPAP